MGARAGAGVAGALTVLLAAALLGAPADAAARGARRGGGIGKALAGGERKAPAGGNHLTIRSRGSSSEQDEAASATGPAGAALPEAKAPAGPPAEELARRAAALARYEKESADHEAARKAAAQHEEWARDARDKVEARLATQRAEEERLAGARRSAAEKRRSHEQSAASAEVEQLLERAKNDHPVLRTPEGEPILRSILARQQVLQARGMYPGIAMVEAVADHSDALRPRVRAPAAPVDAAPPPAPDYSKTYGSCRWATPYTWSCD